MRPCSSTSIALSSPAMPEAGSGMADIGLGRADRQRRAPVPADGLAERRRLDRVAGGGAGAMRLEIADALRADAGLGHHLAEQRRLRLAGWAGTARWCGRRR